MNVEASKTKKDEIIPRFLPVFRVLGTQKDFPIVLRIFMLLFMSIWTRMLAKQSFLNESITSITLLSKKRPCSMNVLCFSQNFLNVWKGKN